MVKLVGCLKGMGRCNGRVVRLTCIATPMLREPLGTTIPPLPFVKTKLVVVFGRIIAAPGDPFKFRLLDAVGGFNIIPTGGEILLLGIVGVGFGCELGLLTPVAARLLNPQPILIRWTRVTNQ